MPLERVLQIVDFARFIQSQTALPAVEWGDDETQEEIHLSEAKWDALLAKPDSQRLLLDLAREAVADDEAGLTLEMVFDEDGNLIEPA